MLIIFWNTNYYDTIFGHNIRINIICIITYIYVSVYMLYNTAVLIKICRFETTSLNYAKPLRNWTFQRIARAARKKGRNGTNEISDTR